MARPVDMWASVNVLPRWQNDDLPPTIAIVIGDVTSVALWVEDGDPYSKVAGDIIWSLCTFFLGR